MLLSLYLTELVFEYPCFVCKLLLLGIKIAELQNHD